MNYRRLSSVFIAWHLLAISIGALPPPERFSNFPKREPTALGAPFDSATAAVDSLTQFVAPFERMVWWVTRPIDRAARVYRSLAGLNQSWAMFSNPPKVDEYVRVRYYVEERSGRRWTATELVSPAHREDRVRLVKSYRDSYQDKAIAIAVGGFYTRRRASSIRPDTKPSELPDDLAPIGRYFARTFARRALSADQKISRVEVWVGRARTPPPGAPRVPDQLAERLDVLEAYYEGPVEQRFNVSPYPPYHAGEHEADIEWLLEYYEAS